MASQAPPLSLSELVDRYRSRMLQLNCYVFTKFLKSESISPYSTDPEDLELIEEVEWQAADGGLPPSVRTPNDIYALLSDGTSSPCSQEKREELFRKIEFALNAQVAPEFRPLYLPEDFKELCGLTDSLEGAGLPCCHADTSPDAFNGLTFLEPLPAKQLEEETYLDLADDWEVAAGVQTGYFEGQGGMWLCWCRSKKEISYNPGTSSWKWRWCGRYDIRCVMYEDVRELVDEFWDEWRGINYVYGKLDYASIL